MKNLAEIWKNERGVVVRTEKGFYTFELGEKGKMVLVETKNDPGEPYVRGSEDDLLSELNGRFKFEIKDGGGNGKGKIIQT